MKILILAAGYAIRLHPLTIDTPKPLLPVGRKKMIDWILDKAEHLKNVDIIYVITNAKFFEKFEEWAKGSKYHDKIAIINDGTMTNETRHGAIKDLEITIIDKRINDDLLVIAGDNLFDFELTDFLKFAVENRDGISIALHDIKDMEAAKKFGVVKLDGQKRIMDFEEKPAVPKSTLISTGIYYIPKGKLSSIKAYLAAQTTKSDAPGYYISWMSKMDKVYGLPFDEEWCDIGDIESYKKAGRKYS